MWAEVDLDRLVHNLQIAKNLIGERTKVMAVVKANAYGHGVGQISKTVLDNGVAHLAVATVAEGVELRNNNINAPILLLCIPSHAEAEKIASFQLTATVGDYAFPRCLNDIARERKQVIKVHVRVDTGMGSAGVLAKDCLELLKYIKNLEWLELEGIYTHLNSAYGCNKNHALEQLGQFQAILNELPALKITIPLVHTASSPALGVTGSEYDMIRPGIMLYGMRCRNQYIDDLLKPVMQLKARVTCIKEVGSNFRIGYGWNYSTNEATRIATLPLGYADAYFLYYINQGDVLIHGQRAPILAKPFMDHCIVDINHINNVEIGDEAVFIGEQDNEAITVEELAGKSGIGPDNLDLLSLLGLRVPRIYTGQN
ncbi:MAG: alanine racemase, partial [Syntrophomonadaceae bacterium]|nr:alanine racemase [Syntrophomonadaceae bacterium]